MTLARGIYSTRVPFEKVTVLSIERSLSERSAVDCLPVTTDMPVSLKAAMWDDRKSAISGHRCIVAAAPSIHLSLTTGVNRFDV